MAKTVDFFYHIVIQNDKEVKTPYPWKKGEKEKYFAVCNLVKCWGGIPLDVPWATSTNSYREALKQYQLRLLYF